jgi:argininosuccinate synthase
MDREVTRLRDSLGTKIAESIYYGFWFAPEFEIMRSMVDQTQETVSGDVRIKLYKGNVIVTGRKSPYSLYKERVVTFEDDAGAYDQQDAEGFIKLQALRLRLRQME